MPEVPTVIFETEERVIGTSSSFVGIVSDLGSLDQFPIESKHRGVEIEKKAGVGFGEIEYLQPELIVNF